MWWVLLWAGASVVSGGVFGRFLRSKRVFAAEIPFRDFFDSLIREWDRQVPDLPIAGISGEGMGVVIADESLEFALPMADLYTLWLRAALSERDARMAELVAARRRELRQLFSRTHYHATQGDRRRIYPQIRMREWVDRQSPAFGIGAIVTHELEGDLVVCYVWGGEEELSLINEAELRALGLSREELADLALSNLNAECEAFDLVPSEEEQAEFVAAEGRHAAEQVLLALAEEVPGLDQLVFALPERGELHVASRGKRLNELMRHVEESHAGAEEPLPNRQLEKAHE